MVCHFGIISSRRGLAGLLIALLFAACGSSPLPTTTASVSTPSAPTPAAMSITGTWRGTGSDSFGPELVTWKLTQSGSAVSGVAEMNAVDPADGTCGSCHKVKRGTFSGTLSGTSLSVTMTFPAGADVPSPICVADLAGSATIVDNRMTASYSGTDTCEGFFADGKIELTRQP